MSRLRHREEQIRAGWGVHSGTSRSGEGQYASLMKLQYKKAICAAAWVCIVCSVGLLVQLTSRTAWIVIAALAVLPPLVMMRYWNDPPQSMSESIREVLQ